MQNGTNAKCQPVNRPNRPTTHAPRPSPLASVIDSFPVPLANFHTETFVTIP